MPVNMFSAEDADPGLAGIGTWGYQSSNCSYAADANGVALTVTTITDAMYIGNSIYPVLPNTEYTVIASGLNSGTTTHFTTFVNTFTSALGYLTSYYGNTVSDSPSGTQSFVTFTTGPTAAFVNIAAAFNSITPAIPITETKFVNQAGLFVGTNTTWSPGGDVTTYNNLVYESVANGESVPLVVVDQEVYYDSVANGEFFPLVTYPASGQLDLTFSNFALPNANINNSVLYTSTAFGSYNIYQADPFFGNVNPLVSAEFATQLNFTNAVQPAVYTITTASPNLAVSESGRITGAKVMPVGTYTIAGTVLDANGGYGNWVFNLNVVTPTTPGSSVVPIIAPTATALPTGLEMLVPFQIDPATGAVASITNYAAILAQHIETIIMTTVGERLMIPNFGSRLVESTFAPIHGASLAMLAQDIKGAVQTWEPAVNIINVNVSTNPSMAASTLIVTVDFSVVPYNSVSTVVVNSGGSVIQVSGS